MNPLLEVCEAFSRPLSLFVSMTHATSCIKRFVYVLLFIYNQILRQTFTHVHIQTCTHAHTYTQLHTHPNKTFLCNKKSVLGRHFNSKSHLAVASFEVQ